jgi:Ser/Thr protein kinase RdoA (MazF antagonist)
VFRLETTIGRYAVKELRNPWAEPRFAQRLAEAWAFEQAARTAGVAAPEPIPALGGSCTATVTRADGQGTALVRVHRWVDGESVEPGPVAPVVARWAGETLARLHALAVSSADRSLFPGLAIDTAGRWPALIAAAPSAGASVAAIADLAAAALRHPDEEVMSHADVDQKNLVLAAVGPVLCDWDVASPVVPQSELADVALALGDWADVEIARTVVRAYRAAGGRVGVFAPPDLAPSLVTYLDWMDLNVAWERLPALLRTLDRRVAAALDVAAALNA